MNRHRIASLCGILAIILPVVSCQGDTSRSPDPTGAATVGQSPTAPGPTVGLAQPNPPNVLPVFGPKDRVHLYIGMKNDQPGWSQSASYSAAGLDTHLADYLGQEKELNFRWDRIDVPSGDREKKITSGDVQFVIATYSMTDYRRSQVDFLGPYMKTTQSILVRADSKIKTKADIDGSTQLCTATGGLSASAKPVVGTVNVETDYSQCVKKLLAGNVEAVFTDTLILYGYADQSEGKLKVLRDINLGDPTEYGIGLPKGSLKDPGNCAAMFRALHDFLVNDWEQAFQNNLPLAYQEDKAAYVQHYRPNPELVTPEKNCGGGKTGP